MDQAAKVQQSVEQRRGQFTLTESTFYSIPQQRIRL